MSLKIGVIVSTTRPTRVGRNIADWFMQQVASTPDVDFQIIDLAEVNLPLLDEPKSPMRGDYQHAHTKAWAKVIDEFDGFVWVTAEYNHGYPAPLKNAIDTLHKEWGKKPVAFVGYGGMGGARAIEQLVAVACEVNMVPLSSTALKIIDVWEALEENGSVKPEYVRGDAASLVKNLIWWAKLLKGARTQE
jgi:NAD(P)H-dependent FMN reductase